jgi:hypothetical protein
MVLWRTTPPRTVESLLTLYAGASINMIATPCGHFARMEDSLFDKALRHAQESTGSIILGWINSKRMFFPPT